MAAALKYNGQEDLDLISVKEGAKTILHIPLSTAYELCNRGELPHVRLGGTIKFDRATLVRWVRTQIEASVHARVQEKRPVVRRFHSAGSEEAGTPEEIPPVDWR